MAALLRSFATRCALLTFRRAAGLRLQTTASATEDENLQDLISQCSGEDKLTTGVVLGVYLPLGDPLLYPPKFTSTAEKYNERTKGMLEYLLKVSGPVPQLGEPRIFYDLEKEFDRVVVVGLGPQCAGYNDMEEREEEKEAIRVAAAVGCRKLQSLRTQRIHVEDFGHAESAAEGAALAVWLYQELKRQDRRLHMPHLELFQSCDFTGWHIGLEKAAAQNLARHLAEAATNRMTPTIFAHTAVEVLCKSGVNVEVKVQGWAETQKMGGFLAAAKGSCEPPIFLEISYYGTSYDERPVVLVGKGVTFDSGGLCLKTPHGMLHMRGDVTGAACVVATVRAVAHLQLPINIRGLVPLCENMPGCLASKPGDVVTTMSGKRVLVQNPDCEGRLMLADSLYYAHNFWPRFMVDVGTMTMDARHSMGSAATVVFTNSDALWEQIRMAGVHTGDRLWRFPLWDYYTKQVSASTTVDLKNVGLGPGGGACKAAAFLRQFVPCGEWMHLDNFGVMMSNGIDEPYLRRGMSGRPTRTLIEFISQLVCKPCP
ncbi:cytosol aminopeptidase-like [Periplaneta americana]|uniref:cytosol aminopeptidase-like n=1 Tax=Periplaneta americana TaxID=6978 RepID=UPI0037E8C2DD